MSHPSNRLLNGNIESLVEAMTLVQSQCDQEMSTTSNCGFLRSFKEAASITTEVYHQCGNGWDTAQALRSRNDKQSVKMYLSLIAECIESEDYSELAI
jgi:hypothetical protein